MDFKNVQMLDVMAPDHGVEVEIDQDRRVLYVHVDGVTVLRICRIPAEFTLMRHANGIDYPFAFPPTKETTS